MWFLVGYLGKTASANIAIHLAKDNLPGLIINLTSIAINKFDIKISGKGAVRAGKGFTLFIWYEDMNEIIIIIKSLEDSDELVTETFYTLSLTPITTNFFSSKRCKWKRKEKNLSREENFTINVCKNG